MKYNLFYASSFYKSGMSSLGELHCLHHERDKSNSPSFSEFLHTAPIANETTIVVMKQMFFNTLRLHEYDTRDMTEQCR